MEDYRLEHLLSSMYEVDFSIAERSQIKSDLLLINQCDKNEDVEIHNDKTTWRMLSTTERGLSRSRNMAINQATGNVGLLCDNDEVFCDGYVEKVLGAYKDYPQADIIIFDIKGQEKRIKREPHRLGYLELLRVSSLQISFKIEKIREKGIRFNVNMGSGTSNGAEEEVKFLLDCHKAKLTIWYVPVIIAELLDNESAWFKGYDERFFENRGKTTRYILGFPLAVLYAVYYVIRKRSMYCDQIPVRKAAVAITKGICKNELGKMEKRNG